MMKKNNVKDIVKEKYGEIATQANQESSSCCCGSGGCNDGMDYTLFSDDYKGLEGYNPDADLGLGCGIPTQFAGIESGDHLLDLGSGAGNDCFVARSLVGEAGKITGIDFTDEMIVKARANLEKTGFQNIEFIKGDIEKMPLQENSFDVVISNCVLNLVPDKVKAFSEIHRVLKAGGHFCISDIVINGELPGKIKDAAEMYAGCVSGAIQKELYLTIIENCGFRNIEIKKEKLIEIPDTILLNYISRDELQLFKKNDIGISSITVTGVK